MVLKNRNLISFIFILFVVLFYGFCNEKSLVVSERRTKPVKQVLSAKVWRTGIREKFPEEDVLDSLGKLNTGLAISGGGLRSYMSTLGYFSGLRNIYVYEGISLLERLRYISCVSGGSWASVSFLYQMVTDEVFLDASYAPEQLDLFNLATIGKKSGKDMPVRLDVITEGLVDIFIEGYDPSTTWYSTIQEVFFSPVEIPERAIFLYDFNNFHDFYKRNIWITNIDYEFVIPGGCKFSFLTQKEIMFSHGNKRTKLNLNKKGMKDWKTRWNECIKDKPFVIVNSALLGPKASAPFKVFHMEFTQMEFTPLYIGSNNPLDLKFGYSSSCNHEAVSCSHKYNLSLGGFIEAFAFDTAITNEDKIKLLSEEENQKILTLEHIPEHFFSLGNASGASSWAPGSLLSEEAIINRYLNKYIGLEIDYWSPQARYSDENLFHNIFRTVAEQQFASSQKVLLADSGSLENQGLMSLLQRKVTNIVCFINTDVPLSSAEKFNPFTHYPTRFHVDVGFLSLFGFPDPIPVPGFDLKHNQVFSKIDYPWIVADMQLKKKEGNGIVVESLLKTVRNDWFGIEEGFEVKILWVYLDRPKNWFDALSDPVQQYIKKNCKKFPFIPTDVLDYTPQLANLMSNLATWVIDSNRDLFIKYLSP
eukprot:augustus_masked-scaffold_8-processed-gene-3.10-mRNA-1 protein AED:1.00 eAED:1.00 QI:0/-1/0/0/-1/1/1/0/645